MQLNRNAAHFYNFSNIHSSYAGTEQDVVTVQIIYNY